MQPRRTSSLGDRDCTSTPSNRIEPLVTSPRSACSRLETAFQRRCLARTIGAEKRDNSAPRHIQRYTLQHQDDVAVDNLDIVD